MIVRVFLKDADFLANFQAKPGFWKLRAAGGTGKAGSIPGGLLDVGWAKDIRASMRTLRQDMIVRGKVPEWVQPEHLEIEVRYTDDAEAAADAALADYVKRNGRQPPLRREPHSQPKRS